MIISFDRASDPHPADISVVIPVYNHEPYVGAAIESLLAQTVTPREVICIDDGSTDGSASRVEALARRSPIIRFRSRPNQGAHRTLNEAIEAAQGAYVAILNSDDVYHRTRLARCLSVLEADPAISAVATEIDFIDGAGKAVKNAWYDKARAFYRNEGDLGLALVNGNFLMTTSNLVVRRTLFAEVGGFANLRYAHDLDFLLRLVAHGKRITILRAPLLSYRVHSSNTISESHIKVRLEWAAATAAFARRLAACGGDRGGQGSYLGRVMQVAKRHDLLQFVAVALLAPAATARPPEDETMAASLLRWLQQRELERED
jgi:glycosyltransferase involved in cell wall biosynthesis